MTYIYVYVLVYCSVYLNVCNAKMLLLIRFRPSSTKVLIDVAG